MRANVPSISGSNPAIFKSTNALRIRDPARAIESPSTSQIATSQPARAKTIAQDRPTFPTPIQATRISDQPLSAGRSRRQGVKTSRPVISQNVLLVKAQSYLYTYTSPSEIFWEHLM